MIICWIAINIVNSTERLRGWVGFEIIGNSFDDLNSIMETYYPEEPDDGKIGFSNEIKENQIAKAIMPKNIAKITICGAVKLFITDAMPFTHPTEEQRKNLKEMLCIDVEILE